VREGVVPSRQVATGIRSCRLWQTSKILDAQSDLGVGSEEGAEIPLQKISDFFV